MQKPILAGEQYQELIRSACGDRIIEIERLLSSYEFDEKQLNASLYHAMENRRLAAFVLLLEKGANPHRAHLKGIKPPLCQAVDWCPEFVKPLLVFGANPLEIASGWDTSALLCNSRELRRCYQALREADNATLNDMSRERREELEKEIETRKQVSRLFQSPSSFSCFNVAACVLQRECGIKRRHEDFTANRTQYCAAAKKHAVVLEDALRHGDLQQFRILLKKFENKDTKTREQDTELGIAVSVCFTDGYYEQIRLLAQCGADVDKQFLNFVTNFHDTKYAEGIAYCLSNNLIKPDSIRQAYEEVKAAIRDYRYYISQVEFDKRKLAIQTLLEDTMKVKKTT